MKMNSIYSISQVVFRRIGERAAWYSFIATLSLLIVTEIFFEPAIDHFMEGSIFMAYGVKLAFGIILKPVESKIQLRTSRLASSNRPADVECEDDDNWAFILIGMYRSTFLTQKS